MSNKTLIIYALYEETVETDFFLDNGIIDDENVDYIFVVNDLNFSPSEKFSKTTTNLSDRCSVFYRENIGYDFGGYAYAVDYITKNKKIDSYDFFVFLNQTVIGPIFPAWYKCSKNNWAELFTNKITETVKISGVSINCFYFDMEKQEWIYSPHVQTMLFATDRVGLDIGIKKRILSYDNVMADKMWVVMAKEIEFSKSVLEAGYNISCLLSRAQDIDFKEKFEDAWKDPWFPEENIHPYETVFFKNNRNITPELINSLTKTKTTNFKVVIPCYNCEEWIGKTITSIKEQTYRNFNCIIVDDISTDNTAKVIEEKIQGDKRFTLVKNTEKKYALKNLYDNFKILNQNDEDVFITIDGDDWLYDNKVFEKLNHAYLTKKCLMTYGTFVDTNGNVTGHVEQGPYSESTIYNNSFREDVWKASHLRTFKAKLWNSIKREDFINIETNEFYNCTWDLAFMFPMLEMAGERSLYIKDKTYVYNTSNPISDMYAKQAEQIRLNKIIRSKSKYTRKEFI